MPSKYDTNPLDPDFPERARAAAEEQETVTLNKNTAATRQFDPGSITEEQTRRFEPQQYQNYTSPYGGQYVPANIASAAADLERSSSRKVDKIGLPENILTALPYIPWYIGMVFGLLILFLVPKRETKVRFHAAQGLAAHVAILIVTTTLGLIGNVTGVADAGNVIFQIITSIMLIIFAIKAWSGKPVHIESVDSLTNWLEEKIKPAKG